MADRVRVRRLELAGRNFRSRDEQGPPPVSAIGGNHGRRLLSGDLDTSADEAVQAEERPLLVVHLVWEPHEPLEPVRHAGQDVASGKGQVCAEREPDRPVESLPGMTRVLDVAEEFIDPDIGADLVERDSVHGVGQRLGESDRPARETPQTVARSPSSTGQQHTGLGADDDLGGKAGYLPEDPLVIGLGERSRHGAIKRR